MLKTNHSYNAQALMKYSKILRGDNFFQWFPCDLSEELFITAFAELHSLQKLLYLHLR